MYTNKDIIAIDGGAGTGKSLLSSLLAEELGLKYIDTGQFYRIIALFSEYYEFEDVIDRPLSYYYKNINITINYNGSKPIYSLNGIQLNDDLLRGSKISLKASILAENICIRLYITEIIHNLIKNDSFIVCGRDIGTFVYPHARYKIYIDTPISIRVKRILSRKKNDENAYNSVLKEILERDYRDMNRAFAPLTRTNNQLLLDATNLSPEQAINHITDYINLINKNVND